MYLFVGKAGAPVGRRITIGREDMRCRALILFHFRFSFENIFVCRYYCSPSRDHVGPTQILKMRLFPGRQGVNANPNKATRINIMTKADSEDEISLPKRSPCKSRGS